MSNFSQKFVDSLVENYVPENYSPTHRVMSTLTKEMAESCDGVTADVDLFAAFNVELPSGHDLWTVRPYKYGDSQLKAVAKTVRLSELSAKNAKIERLAAFYSDPQNEDDNLSAFDFVEFCTPVTE